MRTLAVIPARYRSTRLPGKPLVDIAGRAMIEHVYRRTVLAKTVDRVIVATDDGRVRDRVVAFGGDCVMTSPHHASGTDRVAEVAGGLDAELVVNVQGDEPLIEPRAIDQAVVACKENGCQAIVSLRQIVRSAAEAWDPNVVKVVTDPDGRALYFSRWPIPFIARPNMSMEMVRRLLEGAGLPLNGIFHKHIGLYVYPRALLLQLSRAEPSPLERLEQLEQLRALERGIPIRLVETEYEAISVDTPADLESVRRIFEDRSD